jgi:DNA polymerase V
VHLSFKFYCFARYDVLVLDCLHRGAPRYTVRMSSGDPFDAGIVRVGRVGGDPAAPARASVAAGFGSPADDTGVTRLDLNDILVKHPLATFVMSVAGCAMREAGIDDGDIVVVDRAVTPTNGHVVIAAVDGEFICRRLAKQGTCIRLEATDADTADIDLREGDEAQVWGVVTHAIKPMPT